MALPHFTPPLFSIRRDKSSKFKQAFAKNLLCSIMLSGVTFTAIADNSEVTLEHSYTWNIPSQTLNLSITTLAEKAGLVIFLEPDNLNSINARALHGQMTLDQALQSLLRGSGLSYEIQPGNRLLLQSVDQNPLIKQSDAMIIVGDWLEGTSESALWAFPGARHLLTQSDFEKAGAASLTEAFRKIPGMQVRVPAESYGANHALSVGVRGLKSRFSEKSTILLDGMPLSFAPYGQPQLSIAPITLGNLAAVDVITGGSSVRYGPQNVGGVINFVTPDIPVETATRIKLRGEGAVNEGENGLLGQVNAFTGGYITDDTGLALIYSGSHGSGYRENSNEDIDDLMLKAETWLSDTQQLEGHIRYFEAETEISGGLNQSEYAADPYQSRYNYNHFKGDRKEGRIKYTNLLSDTQEFEIQAFAANTYRLYGLQFNPDSRQRYDEWGREYDVYGIEPRFSQIFDLGDTRQEVSIGYRYIKEEADLTRYRWNNFAVGSDPHSVKGVFRTKDEAGTTAHAAYIDDQISYGKLTVTPGVRLENVEVYRHSLIKKNTPNDFRNEESYNELLPSLSIAYQLSPEVMVFGNYNTSFGTLQHLQLSDSTRNELKPEIAKTIELGSRYRHQALTTEFTLFNINFSDKLQYDDSLGHHVNRGKTHHYGIELGASYEFTGTGMSIYNNLTYTQAEFEEGDLAGNELPYYSNWIGNLGLQYQRDVWTYNIEAYGQSKQYSDNENTDSLAEINNTYFIGHLPGFITWNARASYQMPTVLNGSNVSVGIKNLFNQNYYTLSGPDQPYGAGISAGAPLTTYVELDMAF